MTTTIHIKLTDTEREQLARVTEDYREFNCSAGEVAHILLHDALRAKLATIPAKREEPYTEEQREADERAYFEAFGFALVGDGDEADLVDID